MLANPWNWDGYVFVVCFDPANLQIRWSFHTQGNLTDAAR
jgi:hypothetical protein